ncbi:MAG: zinc-binding dehydrogenase [Hyphomicrobiaceae bacterium]
MRALAFQETGRPLALVERPMPVAGPGEVVLRVAYCGICGSDIHSTEASASQVPAGTVLGHEFSGIVSQSGDPEWSVDDRVIAVPLWPCDACKGAGTCKDNLGILCPRNKIVGLALDVPGGYAEFVKIGARHVLSVPDNVALDAAALAEPLAVGAHAVRLAGSLRDKRVLVIGAGPIGLATVAFARRAGAKDVVVSELDAVKLARALELGAAAGIDPGAGDIAAAFAGITAGAPDCVFECVGVPGILQQCLAVAGIGASIVVVGVCRHEDTILPRMAIRKELKVQFVLGYTAEDFTAALDLLQSGTFDANTYITERAGFATLPELFETLRKPNAHGKVVLEPGADHPQSRTETT